MTQLSESKRETVLERDGRECQFCGVTNAQHKEECGRGLEVHHIVPRRANGSDDIQNLMVVCRSCHNTLEYTQGDALERVKEANQSDEMRGLKEENAELKQELAELQASISNDATEKRQLIQTVHELERLLRDETFIAGVLEGQNTHAQVVTSKFGTESLVTSDDKEAVDAYEEWGSRVERVNVKIKNGESIADWLVRRYLEERKYR